MCNVSLNVCVQLSIHFVTESTYFKSPENPWLIHNMLCNWAIAHNKLLALCSMKKR